MNPDEAVLKAKELVRDYDQLSQSNTIILTYIGRCAIDTLVEQEATLSEKNGRYHRARKKLEERYAQEYDVQNEGSFGSMSDGLMLAMSIIDKELRCSNE